MAGTAGPWSAVRALFTSVFPVQCGCSVNMVFQCTTCPPFLKLLCWKQLLHRGNKTERESDFPGFESLLHHLALRPSDMSFMSLSLHSLISVLSVGGPVEQADS